MAWRKKVTTFVSNWLGVFIAAIIVIISATFGGMYLYARTRIDNSISFTTQSIRYYELTNSGVVENPPGFVYHLALQVYNPYADTIDVVVSDVTVSMDEYDFTVVQDGSWDKSVPTGYALFEGDITIPEATSDALVAKGTIDVNIEGDIAGSGQYQWVRRAAERPFDIHIPGVLFQLITPSEAEAGGS